MRGTSRMQIRKQWEPVSVERGAGLVSGNGEKVEIVEMENFSRTIARGP